MPRALISLGSNLGERKRRLEAACERLAALPQTALLRRSSLRETKPVGGPSGQEPFLNAAALLETSLEPQRLLDELQNVESELGRVRDVHWGPRTIDLDLLLYDDVESSDPRLTVPHPRFAFRRFVLEPAAEIAAEMTYPINGWSVGRLLAHLNTSQPMIAFAGRGAAELAATCGEIPGVEWTLDTSAPAKLLVLLVDPRDTAEQSRLDALRRHPASPPALWLTSADHAADRDEVMAAVAAME